MLVYDAREVELTLGSLGSFLANPFVGIAGNLRMLTRTALATLRYRALDLAAPETLAAYDDRSIEQEALARLGRGAYELLVRPGIEPFWYFSCAEASRALLLALQARAASARFFTLRDGMDSIATRLLDGIELRAGADVHAIERDGAGLRIEGERFAEVVLATTAGVALSLAREHAVVSPPRALLSTQRYVPNVHAAFGVRVRAARQRARASRAAPGSHPVAAVAFNSHKRQGKLPAEREIVSVFLGARGSARLLDDAPPAMVFQRAWAAARQLCPALPREAAPLRCAVRREAIPLHAVRRYRLAAATQRAQRGPLVFAGDYLVTGTVEGALRSGLRAADAQLGASSEGASRQAGTEAR